MAAGGDFYSRYTVTYEITEKDKKRFWAKVDKRGPDECWEWTACTDNCGIGIFYFKKSTKPHLFAWALKHGEIINGHSVLRLCQNKGCVNPDHYELKDDEKRFHSKYKKGSPDECWLWQAALGRRGYGRFQMNKVNQMAHRMAWAFKNGPIAEGLYVLHRCDVPGCVNPAHLYLGTHDDNMRDRNERDRVPKGETCVHSKYKEVDVLKARELYSNGVTIKEICIIIGIPRSSMSAMLSRRTWKHI
jgi:hypothetical protein